jgi:iron complex transport system ATP-binding protein
VNEAIRFEGLGHGYLPGDWLFRAYDGGIAQGSVCAVLGPNGRGKTTLLKCLLGSLHPREGKVHLQGRVAFVPQLFQVSFPFKVLDMVLMGRARQIGLFSQPSHQDELASLEALSRLGMAGLAERSFDELSGGQRQLVIFARALASGAEILILDEPTSALDLKNQGVILKWIRKLSRDHDLTILMTTHHPHHALAVADTALLMLEHNEYVFGTAEETLTEANLHTLYGVNMRRVGFEYDGQHMETLVPVFPIEQPSGNMADVRV